MDETRPTSAHDKLALLKAAIAAGDRLRAVLELGSPADRLRTVAADEGLTMAASETGLMIRFGEYIWWNVTLGADDTILGYSASGYGALMDVLGIDLAGRPHVPGD